MNKILLICGVVVIMLSMCNYLHGQSSCAQTLRTARATYDHGKLHELPALLDACLKNGFTQEEKVEAYKLLTLAYIYLEEPAKADGSMLELLRTNPYFQINEAADPAEFVSLYRTFRTNPVTRVGVKIGVNASQPNVKRSIETNSGESSYSYRIAFQFGATVEVPLNEQLALNPSLLFQQKSFTIDNTVRRGNDATGNPLINHTSGGETQTWMSIPVVVQYIVKPSRYNPYVSAGVSTDLLLSSQLSLETTQDGAGSVQERTLDLMQQRNKVNVSAILCAGAKMRIFGGYFTAEITYSYGLTNITSENTAYKEQELAFNNNLGDSIYKLNSLSVTAGYVQNIFNPKKLKRKR